MKLFEYLTSSKHEQVIFCHDEPSGLKAIIAIHSTALGPALGGCRFWHYESEEDALNDALRLSRGMTYKNAAMGLDNGGAKCVVLLDETGQKSEAALKALGRFIQGLGGRYITAEDVGATPDDMLIIASETRYVGGLPGRSGDPSPLTALGTLRSIEVTLEYLGKKDGLLGATVAISGLGHVGSTLAKLLHDRGAKLYLTDIRSEKMAELAKQFDAIAVQPDEIYSMPVDVFAPCALGGILNDTTIDQLKCQAIVGSANNQLLSDLHGDLLFERNILYAPDFIVNGAGVINVANEFHPDGYHEERVLAQIQKMGDTLKELYLKSEQTNTPPFRLANQLAEQRIYAKAHHA